jgi:tRNA(Glu) U13 pseudouridine synthase TruD
MRYTIKAQPEDFVVEEALAVQPGKVGDYALYKVTKRLLTTLEVQERIAQQLNIPPREVIFPALKDKGALATQYCTVRTQGPQRLSGNGYQAELAGRLPRHITPRDISGNRFSITIGVGSASNGERLAARIAEIGRTGLPNYFDEQRFGSYAPGGGPSSAKLSSSAMPKAPCAPISPSPPLGTLLRSAPSNMPPESAGAIGRISSIKRRAPTTAASSPSSKTTRTNSARL